MTSVLHVRRQLVEDARDINMVIGLEWMGFALFDHIKRIWFPDRGLNTAKRHKKRLQDEGLIRSVFWYETGAAQPRRRGAMWSLTDTGRSYAKQYGQYPDVKLPKRSVTTQRHDIMTAEVLTRIIELARRMGSFSGMVVMREHLLTKNRRPITDALVIVRLGGDPAPPGIVPWTNDPRAPGERSIRFAVETDRGTEPLSVIQAKAVAYRKGATNDWLAAHGGAFPIQLWILPTQRRLEHVLNVYKLVDNQYVEEATREGKHGELRNWVMLTTDGWLAQDFWIEYRYGRTDRSRSLFGSVQQRIR